MGPCNRHQRSNFTQPLRSKHSRAESCRIRDSDFGHGPSAQLAATSANGFKSLKPHFSRASGSTFCTLVRRADFNRLHSRFCFSAGFIDGAGRAHDRLASDSGLLVYDCAPLGRGVLNHIELVDSKGRHSKRRNESGCCNESNGPPVVVVH